jgi:hypothetical protein
MAQPPSTIGRFQIRAELGQGAFGTVYLAFDPQFGREVALKVPHPGTLANPKACERFLREAMAAGRLQHPNIVPIFEVSQDGQAPYIVSAFISGKNLAQALAEERLDLSLVGGTPSSRFQSENWERASFMAAASGKRFSGSRARARWITAANPLGMSGRRFWIGTGSCSRITNSCFSNSRGRSWM